MLANRRLPLHFGNGRCFLRLSANHPGGALWLIFLVRYYCTDVLSPSVDKTKIYLGGGGGDYPGQEAGKYFSLSYTMQIYLTD